MRKNHIFYSLGLFVGDLAFLTVSLWFTLLIRYVAWPSQDLFFDHLRPFFYIFLIWSLVYFIYDLYRSQLYFFRQKIVSAIFNAHILNSVLAVLFFYFIPYFGITPKTNMFIFLLVSFLLILFWRLWLASYLLKTKSEHVVFACVGPEVEELKNQFKSNNVFNVRVYDEVLDLGKIKEIYPEASLVAISSYGKQSEEISQDLYGHLFSGLRFANVESMYEDLFGRVPISLISQKWFLDHISNEERPVFEFFKRIVDIFVGILIGLVFLIFLPFIYVFIKLDDGGLVFFHQLRVGKYGKPFKLYKVRSMKEERVTKVGKFLRKTRVDELPQFWNLIKGDVSLVGPRAERVDYVEKYRDIIPYYDVRHLVSPGLTGWAQIYHENHPHFSPEISATKEKLTYDLYYIKNKSLLLDLGIIFKTIRILLSQAGK